MSRRDGFALLIYVAYYVGFASLIAALSRCARLSREVIRKSYHIACSLSIFILIRLFDHWYAAAISSAIPFALGVLAILIGRKIPSLAGMRIDRHAGGNELLRQVLSAQTVFVLLVTVCWGVLGPSWKHHAAVGLVAWGFGDAFAAIVGRRFGKRKVACPAFDTNKTVEGSSAGAVAAFLAIFVTLWLLSGLPWYATIGVSAALAVVTSLLELVSKKGLDNLLIPLGVAVSSASLHLIVLAFMR